MCRTSRASSRRPSTSRRPAGRVPCSSTSPRMSRLRWRSSPTPKRFDLPGYKPVYEADPSRCANAAELLNRAERPVIIAGRGVIISQAYEELRQLAETMQAPVVHTLLGLGSFPPQAPPRPGHDWACMARSTPTGQCRTPTSCLALGTTVRRPVQRCVPAISLQRRWWYTSTSTPRRSARTCPRSPRWWET